MSNPVNMSRFVARVSVTDADRERYRALVEGAWRAGEDTRKYSLDELREMRERGETATRADAPVFSLEADFSENASVVMPPRAPGHAAAVREYGEEAGGITWIRRGQRLPFALRRFLGAALTLCLLCGPAAAQSTSKLAIVSTNAEALAGSKVLCTQSCNVTSIYATTTATPVYMMTFNQTTVPADGGVGEPTLRDCVFMSPNSTVAISFDQIADTFKTGMALAFSTTGCDTKTAAGVRFFKVRKSP